MSTLLDYHFTPVKMPTARMSSTSPTKSPRRTANLGAEQYLTPRSSPVRGRKPVRDSEEHEIKIQNAPRSPVHIQPHQSLRPVSFTAEFNNSWTPHHRRLLSSQEYHSASEDLCTTPSPQRTPLTPFSHNSFDPNNFDFSDNFSLSGVIALYPEKMAQNQRPSTAPNGDTIRIPDEVSLTMNPWLDQTVLSTTEQEMRKSELVEPLPYFHTRKPAGGSNPQPPKPRVRRVPEPLNLNVENARPYVPPLLNHGTLRSVSSNPAFDHRVRRGRSPAAGLYIPQSPALRVSSAHSNGSHRSSQLTSYLESPKTSSPQPSPVFKPLAESNTALRGHVGTHALLLSTKETIEMYRKNIPKGDQQTAYAFAMLLIDTSEHLGYSRTQNSSSESLGVKSDASGKGRGSPSSADSKQCSAEELHQQAYSVLKNLASQSNPYAQYYLGDGYSTGFFCKGKKPEDGKALPMFIAASKRGHAESAYRAALCYEFGWGTKVDPSKAIEFLRVSASKAHTGATTRLGLSLLRGDLGQKQYKEGLTWLKRAAETASFQFNSAPYELGLLYENGYGDDVFKDEQYAAQLFTKSAGLGHADAAYKLGEAYEHGVLSCPMDPRLSLHFYTCAAQANNAKAMMAVCALYMTGIDNVLEEDLDEAFEWAMKAAKLGLPKAEYTVGYFRENGIGCRQSTLDANVWYVRAAEHSEHRAIARLEHINRAAEGDGIGGLPPRKAAHRNRLVKAMSSSRSLSSLGSDSRNSSTSRVGGSKGVAGPNVAVEDARPRNGSSHFLTVPGQVESRASSVQSSSPHPVTAADRRFSLGESPQKPKNVLRKRAAQGEEEMQGLDAETPNFARGVERDENDGDGKDRKKSWLGGLWN